jgi:hypothetical protein
MIARLVLLLHAWLAGGLTAVLLYGLPPNSLAGWLLVGTPLVVLLLWTLALPIGAVWLGLLLAGLRRDR